LNVNEESQVIKFKYKMSIKNNKNNNTFDLQRKPIKMKSSIQS